MSLERLRLYSPTSIWRFTIVFTVIVLLICSAMLAIVYQISHGVQKQQLQQSVAVAVGGFIDLANARQMKLADFQRAVISRAENSSSLVLVLKTGDRNVGNLSNFHSEITLYPSFQQFPVAVTDYLGEPTVKMVMGTRINTRFGSLTIGVFDETQQQLEQTFKIVAGATLLGTLLVTLVAGFVFNRRVLARVRAIGELTARVKTGHLQTRLPVSRRHDEYDTIAEQINQMLDEIDELIHSVSSVTDNVAHDLRTPLSRIRIGIDSFKRDEAFDESTELWREGLLEELDRLIDTFEAMLELSRLEKKVLATDKSPCDLAAISSDVIALAEPLAEQKLQSLTFDSEQPLMIDGDANLLFRLVYNLVQNAIKYTPEKGSIKLKIIDNSLLLEDSGPGIPISERERVFQRLHRLDTSRGSEGFGMGLAIVKAIVELHDGVIHLEDNHPGLRVVIVFG